MSDSEGEINDTKGIKELPKPSVAQQPPKRRFAYLILSGAVLALLIAIFVYYHMKENELCDMKIVENRNFYVYYGINQDNNPFGKLNAETAKNVPFFEPILNSKMRLPSMILTGDYGTGKTQIRDYRLSKLDSNTLVVKINGNDPSLKAYFDNFISNIELSDESNKIFSANFKSLDLIDIILAQLANVVIDRHAENLKNEFSQMVFEERFKIACILSFYTNSQLQPSLLEFFQELLSNRDISFENLHSIPQQVYNEYTDRWDDDVALVDAKALFNRVRIFKADEKHKKSIFLFQLSKFVKSSVKSLLQDSASFHLVTLSKFIKNSLNKKLVIVVDSLDENELLFNQGKADKDALQAFVDSAVTHEILGLAGDSEQIAFNILMFLPYIEGITFDKWNRKDIIPVVKLEWDHRLLYDYADFILSYLAKQSHNRCRPLTGLKDLLHDENTALETIKNFQNPRQLHLFMNSLIAIMNINVRIREKPFIATKEDIDNALKETARFNIIND